MGNRWKVLKEAGTPAKTRQRVQKRLQLIIAREVAGKVRRGKGGETQL
jgi:septum formation topological specificity factor MinE